MKYISEFAWILLFSLLGELLHSLIPLPVPASIYGLVLLFAALSCRLVKLEWIRDTGRFLVNIMAVMFVCPAVGLIKSWDVVRENFVPICIIILLSLFVTFWVSGSVTQWILRKEEEHD